MEFSQPGARLQGEEEMNATTPRSHGQNERRDADFLATEVTVDTEKK
jgi:hypothetical protein